MSAGWSCLTVLLALAACGSALLSKENVPVVAWSSSDSLRDVPPLGSTVLLSSALSDIDYKEEKVIVFLQDSLTFDDLAKYASIYGEDEGDSSPALEHVKKYVLESKSSAFLSVAYMPDLSVFLVRELSFLFGTKKVSTFSAEEIAVEDGKWLNADCQICVVNLPDPSLFYRSALLKDNDRVIGQLMESVKDSSSEYIAIFTGKSSQNHVSKPNSDLPTTRKRRQAAGSTTDAPSNNSSNGTQFFYSDDCGFAMVLSNVYIELEENDPNATVPWTVKGAGGMPPYPPVECTVVNNSVSFSVTYSRDGDEDMYIKYTIENSSEGMRLPLGFWRLDLEISSEDGMNATNLYYKLEYAIPYPLMVPSGASFHCSNATFVNENCTKRQARCNEFPQVQLEELQIELFSDNRTIDNNFKFSIDYDCDPYFSDTMWMGIITLSVLLPILIVGLFAVFQTQTMDRFDDPREPALVTTVMD